MTTDDPEQGVITIVSAKDRELAQAEMESRPATADLATRILPLAGSALVALGRQVLLRAADVVVARWLGQGDQTPATSATLADQAKPPARSTGLQSGRAGRALRARHRRGSDSARRDA